MALFEAYEDQIQETLRGLEEKLDKAAKMHAESAKELIVAAEQDVEEAEEVLGKMEMEIRSVKSDVKAGLHQRVARHKGSLSDLKDTLKVRQARAQETEDRNKLLGSGGAGGGEGGEEEYRLNVKLEKSAEQRSRMTAATERLEGASERLLESRKMLRETEAVGEDIMLDLRQQRETLLHARDGMRDVDGNLMDARKIAKQMARRIAQNKRITTIAAACFVVLLVIILASKLQQ